MFLVCHVILQDHIIKGSCDFMGAGVKIFFRLRYEIVYGIVRHAYNFLVLSTVLICNKTAKYALIP